MKNLWNNIKTWQRYIIGAVVFIWIGGLLCMLPSGGPALAAFLSAIILLVCGFASKGDLR
jgi:TctA family transporter